MHKLTLEQIKAFIADIDNQIQKFADEILDQFQDNASEVYNDFSTQMNESLGQLDMNIKNKFENNGNMIESNYEVIEDGEQLEIDLTKPEEPIVNLTKDECVAETKYPHER